jgi:hypothetical protein
VTVYPKTHTFPDLTGTPQALASFWTEGPTLVVHGHRTCGTTRLSLPFADRLHRRRARGAVVVVLQDTPAVAAELARELDLILPILLEPDPYPLATERGLSAVPTLTLVGTDGSVLMEVEGFRRADFETFAEKLGVQGAFFSATDKAPAQRPG